MSLNALGRQFVFHGTSNAGAQNMQRGLRASGQKDMQGMGEGVYVTNSPQAASHFGTRKSQGAGFGQMSRSESSQGQASRQGKRIGTTVVMQPKPGVQPLATRPLNFTHTAGDSQANEMLYRPQDLQIVGTQAINRTSEQRARYGSNWNAIQQQRQQEATPPTLGDLKMRAQIRKSRDAVAARQSQGQYEPGDFN